MAKSELPLISPHGLRHTFATIALIEGRQPVSVISQRLGHVRMMLDHPVWDPETNKRNLLDHVFVACAGDITKQAREWLAQRLDRESRRHVLFMDRDDLLDLALRLSLPHLEESTKAETWVANDDIPF